MFFDVLCTTKRHLRTLSEALQDGATHEDGAEAIHEKEHEPVFGASMKSHNRVLFMSSSSYLSKKLAIFGRMELRPPTESTNLMNACRIHIHVYYTHIYMYTP